MVVLLAEVDDLQRRVDELGQQVAVDLQDGGPAVGADLQLDDVIDLDLAYAPPFSSPWDPVAVAARVLAGEA